MEQEKTFAEWLKALYEFICKAADLQPDQIAIDEEEAQEHYKNGRTPSQVYFDYWQECAGNFLKC